MNEIIVLTRDQLQEVIREAIKTAVLELLPQIQNKLVSEVLTKKEIAEHLKCDISKINRLMKNGLPFVMFGDHPRFYKRDVYEWLKTIKRK